jgi:hypothetical protein
MGVFDIAQLAQSGVYVVELLSYLDFGQLSRESTPATMRIIMVFHSLTINSEDITSMEGK